MNLPTILAFSSAAMCLALSLASAFRARRAVERWAFAAGMAVLGVERIGSGFIQWQHPFPDRMLYWLNWRLTASALLPGTWLFFSLAYARGNARAFLRKWRYVLGAAFVVPIVTALVFRERLVTETISFADETRPVFRLGTAGTVHYLVQLVVAVLVLTNIERTFRAAVGTVRWRVKYMLMGVSLLFVVRLYTTSQTLLFHAVDPAFDVLNTGAAILGSLLILRTLFRAGHFSLDVYPSHAVLQGSVTLLLAGMYLLIVGAFAKVVVYWGGDSAFAFKALVILVLLVLLAMLVQSDRLRLRLRRFISRHLQRPLHDYQTIWRKFDEGTSSRVETVEYCRAVARLLAEIFQSLSVTLWLVDDRGERMTLAASTSVSEASAHELQPDAAGTAAIMQYFRDHAEPVDFEQETDAWAVALRRCHPDEFHKGGTRVGVPLVAGREVLAVIILGDRVSGLSFNLQDFDLLKSIGAHVTSGLLNARLSQRLLQARELEAFQTMAAFFVHDLKNAANTLNLTLQNLPVHFDDPAFRADALRGMAKSVAHINGLIGRLSQLRTELKIAPVSSDLNRLTEEVVAGLELGQDFLLERDFGALPPVSLDRDQFAKVVINLVLNAREAAAGKGRLRLTTRPTGAWVVLTAEDDGCGMTAEFISRSLFRPFQTTKKNGMGIGMFQSRMIVEAHGGRITVESTPGRGTIFRVLLPIAK